MQLCLGRNKGSSDISTAERFASDFNVCSSVRESDWELEASGGRLGEIWVFCFLENTSMLATAPPPPVHEQKSRGVGALQVTSEKEMGIVRVCREVSKCAGEGTRLGVCVSSQPPQGQTSPLARQRDESCSICIKAELITKGSRFSG